MTPERRGPAPPCPLGPSCPLERELREEQADLRALVAGLASSIAELKTAVGILSERLAPISRGFWAAIGFVFLTVGAGVLALVLKR